ncbi:MAG: glycosyltransferase family 2 protein [Nevskiaceae bacterium]|jgi:predicted LPLAT superfamily acyltransferase|nr:glycosyltransferase family 2 protein [Nevskiaceae bacterium]
MKLCAVVPVYRHVDTVAAVIDALLSNGIACIVVDDGNSLEDARLLAQVAAQRQRVEVVRLARNGGKGAAMQAGLRVAGERGYTHALQIDADGQHDVGDIPRFVELAEKYPNDMIYGVPVYDASVPRSRLYGRYITHVWVWIHTLSLEIRDSMCGFRIYPLEPTLELMQRHRLASRMDFDPEIMVRLYWAGVRFRALPTKVVYPPGGLSHFRLWRDNARISWLHTRLFFGMLLRLPMLLWRKTTGRAGRGKHWASIGENTWVGGITLLLLIHRWLGRWPFRIAVFPVVLLNWLLRSSVRRASLEYLRRIESHRPGGRRPTIWLSLRHAMNFAETLLDKLLASGGRLPVGGVRTEGREALYQAVATGRGAIIVTAHVGCLELCQHMAEARGAVALNILVHTRHAEKFNRILRRLNPGSSARFMEVTDFGPGLAMRLADRVAAGECVIIAGDRIPVAGAAVVAAPFLGRQAKFPVGPYLLASLFDCPIFFLCCIHEAGGYVIHFDRLAERVSLPRGNRAVQLARYATEYAHALEAMLARSPLDWFNFFDFWNQGNDQASGT